MQINQHIIKRCAYGRNKLGYCGWEEDEPIYGHRGWGWYIGEDTGSIDAIVCGGIDGTTGGGISWPIFNVLP